MEWKKWPYWLRGGVIGLISGILLIVLLYFSTSLPYNKFTYFIEECLLGITLLLSLPLSLIINILVPLGNFIHPVVGITFVLVILPINLFFLGALIGFIYSKIKNRNQAKR